MYPDRKTGDGNSQFNVWRFYKFTWKLGYKLLDYTKELSMEKKSEY